MYITCIVFMYAGFDLKMDTEETSLKYGIQVTEVSPNSIWDIVVAFDIGTSYSGYAYSDRKEIQTKSISLNEWVGNLVPDSKAKAPTTILFSNKKTFHSFGYQAEEFYAEQVRQKKSEDWYRFRNFKMILYRERVSVLFRITSDFIVSGFDKKK